MKLRYVIGAASISLATLGSAQAAEISVTLTNLTGGIHFTPRLLVAHTSDVDLFEVGTAASTGLATIAEGGDTSVLGAALDATPTTSTPFTLRFP